MLYLSEVRIAADYQGTCLSSIGLAPGDVIIITMGADSYVVMGTVLEGPAMGFPLEVHASVCYDDSVNVTSPPRSHHVELFSPDKFETHALRIMESRNLKRMQAHSNHSSESITSFRNRVILGIVTTIARAHPELKTRVMNLARHQRWIRPKQPAEAAAAAASATAEAVDALRALAAP